MRLFNKINKIKIIFFILITSIFLGDLAAKKSPPEAAKNITVTNNTSNGPTVAARNITITNNTSKDSIKVYMGFVGNTFYCYSPQDFKFCTFDTGNPVACEFNVGKNESQVIPFNKSCQVSIAFSADKIVWGDCPVSMAEFTLNELKTVEIDKKKTQVYRDTAQVSLVNGINYRINIKSSDPNQRSIADMTKVTTAPYYNGISGVYPVSCDACALSISPPKFPNCPKNNPTKDHCQQGTQFAPLPPCNIENLSGNNSYTVEFFDK